MSFKLTGIQRGTSKKGNEYTIFHMIQPVTDPKYGEGSFVQTEFINPDVDISGIKPGMEIELQYNKGYDGRAYVSSVSVVK